MCYSVLILKILILRSKRFSQPLFKNEKRGIYVMLPPFKTSSSMTVKVSNETAMGSTLINLYKHERMII